MFKTAILLQSLLCIASCATAINSNGHTQTFPPKRLIIDTDMLNFADDPFALGLANVFYSRKEVKILGVVSSVFSRYAPPAIDAINTFYSHGKIPVAIQKPVDNSTINPKYPEYPDFLTGLTYEFPEDVCDGSNTTDPVTLYRHLLSSSPDRSVTIANIGFHDNLYHLLRSSSDKISSLSGLELVKRKVAELVVQGNPEGESFNFVEHSPKYAAYVLTHWPGLVTFVPDAIGNTVFTGARLTSQADTTKNPVAYAVATSVGVNVSHESWDATAIYYATRGIDDVFQFERKKGEIYFLANGSAAWDYKSLSRLQRSIELRIKHNVTLAHRIENLLL